MGRGARGAAVLRALLVALGGLASALAARGLAERAADRTAEAAARGLSDLVAAADEERDDPDPGDAPTVGELVALGAPSNPWPPAASERAAGRPSRPHDGRAARPGRPEGLLIRRSVVAAAIATGVVPSGVPIGPSGPRPAGLRLVGVSGYGSALRDGDVLTRVGGTPATSASRVIGAVSGAVRSGARAIDGEIWRDGRPLQVVVEIPPIGPKKRKSRRSRPG